MIIAISLLITRTIIFEALSMASVFNTYNSRAAQRPIFLLDLILPVHSDLIIRPQILLLYAACLQKHPALFFVRIISQALPLTFRVCLALPSISPTIDFVVFFPFMGFLLLFAILWPQLCISHYNIVRRSLSLCSKCALLLICLQRTEYNSCVLVQHITFAPKVWQY